MCPYGWRHINKHKFAKDVVHWLESILKDEKDYFLRLQTAIKYGSLLKAIDEILFSIYSES